MVLVDMDPTVVAKTALGTLVAFWAMFTLLEGFDPMAGARRTRESIFGTVVGILVGFGATVAGIQVAAIFSILGIGAIWAGLSWRMFLATALVTYIVLVSVRGSG